MRPIKYLWAVKAVIYKMTFGKEGNMTYIGCLTFIEGRKKYLYWKSCKNIPRYLYGIH